MAFNSNFGSFFTDQWDRKKGDPIPVDPGKETAPPTPIARPPTPGLPPPAPAPTQPATGPWPAPRPHQTWMWTRGNGASGSLSGVPRMFNPGFRDGWTLTPIEEIHYNNNHRDFYERAVRELGYTSDSPFGQFMFSQYPELESQFSQYGLTHPDAKYTEWARNPIMWLQDRFLNLDARSRGVNPQQFGGGFAGRPNFRG
jgi:hypothetical protein